MKTEKNRNSLLALSVVGAMVLAGCGGGGGSSSGDTAYTDTKQDIIAPVVTLKGEQRITFEQFSTPYKDLGATAEDETDGNVSVNIRGDIGGEPNVYTITYEAYDYSGNRGTAERYVTVTAVPEDANKTKIDVLALYSNGTDALYEGDAETRLVQLMSVTNEIYNTSRTGVEFVLVHSEQFSKISDTDTMETGLLSSQANADIFQIRDNANADEVLIYRLQQVGVRECGRGFINNNLSPQYAIAILGAECPVELTSHELGHNMGNNHSHLQNGENGGGKFPYSVGHIVENDFGTIMSYAEDFGAERKFIFSNPDLECNGQPCGIEAGEVGEADASRTIRETKTAISEFR